MRASCCLTILVLEIILVSLPATGLAVSVVTETYTGEIENGSCRELKLELKKTYHLERIDADKIRFSVDVSSQDRSSVKALIDSIEMKRKGGTIRVAPDQSFRFCSMSRSTKKKDGKVVSSEFTKLEGTCMHDLVIQLPRGPVKTIVYVDGKAVPETLPGGEDASQPNQISALMTASPSEKRKIFDDILDNYSEPMSVNDAILLLGEAGFITRKMDVLDTFVDTNGKSKKVLTVAELNEMLGQFKHDSERIRAVRKLQRNVSDPANAERLRAAFKSESSAKKAIKLIAK